MLVHAKDYPVVMIVLDCNYTHTIDSIELIHLVD